MKITGKIDDICLDAGKEAVKIGGKTYLPNDRARGFVKNHKTGQDVELEIDKAGLINFISKPKTRQFGQQIKDIAMPAPMGKIDSLERIAIALEKIAEKVK